MSSRAASACTAGPYTPGSGVTISTSSQRMPRATTRRSTSRSSSVIPAARKSVIPSIRAAALPSPSWIAPSGVGSSSASCQRSPCGAGRLRTGSCGRRTAPRASSAARKRPAKPRVPSPGASRIRSAPSGAPSWTAASARASTPAVSIRRSALRQRSSRSSSPASSARFAESGIARSVIRRGDTPVSRSAPTASRTALRNPTPAESSTRWWAPLPSVTVASASSSNACSAKSSSTVRPSSPSSAPTSSSASGRMVVTSKPSHRLRRRTSARRISRPSPRVGATTSVRVPTGARSASRASAASRAYVSVAGADMDGLRKEPGRAPKANMWPRFLPPRTVLGGLMRPLAPLLVTALLSTTRPRLGSASGATSASTERTSPRSRPAASPT